MREVALLIPVYNNQDGLRRSLAALSDEYPLDIIVVDDGSDCPVSLDAEAAPHRYHLLRLEKNRGIEHALNLGLRWILDRNYQYVARLDAEDISLPGRFLHQRHFLKMHPDFAMVGGQVRFVDRDGREVFQERFPTTSEEIRRVMHARNCFIHPAVMLRIQALRDVGLYSDRFPAAEDYELFFRIAKKYKVANLADYVVSVVLNPGGISRRRRRRQIATRMKVMFAYFDLSDAASYFGILKNLALLIAPIGVVQAVKRILGERWRGWL